jgi:hypothetical protein
MVTAVKVVKTALRKAIDGTEDHKRLRKHQIIVIITGTEKCLKNVNGRNSRTLWEINNERRKREACHTSFPSPVSQISGRTRSAKGRVGPIKTIRRKRKKAKEIKRGEEITPDLSQLSLFTVNFFINLRGRPKQAIQLSKLASNGKAGPHKSCA